MRRFSKLVAAGLALTMVLGTMVTASAADSADPVAWYDFTNGNLEDKSSHNLGKLQLADYPAYDETIPGDAGMRANADTRSEDERFSSSSASAWAMSDGLKLVNGYVMLPENVFSDSKVEDITGLTVSLKIRKEENLWGGNWNEMIFDFSAKREDRPLSENLPISFFMNVNGNVGTSEHVYANKGDRPGGNWMDGVLAGKIDPSEEWHTITVTYDIATNTLVQYLDGEVNYSSADSVAAAEAGEREAVEASLTAEQIKSLTANCIGHSVDGLDGGWSYSTIQNLVIYTSALDAAQVKTLFQQGPAAVGAATGDSMNAVGFAAVAMVAAAAIVIFRKREIA